MLLPQTPPGEAGQECASRVGNDIDWDALALGVGVHLKDDSTKGATYLHFQNKAVTSDFGESLAMPWGTVW